MKKFLTLLLIIALTPLIGGLYGILHDQLTYTISPEYYTKFKFYQFGLIDSGNDVVISNPRIKVSVVGFKATWWMGIPIGIILGLVGLIHKSYLQMFRAVMKSIGVTIIVAFATGIAGLIYGKFFRSYEELTGWFPENLIDKEAFWAVGSMHNFSYLGGLTGLLAGIIYIIIQKRKYRAIEANK
ncbi:MAG: hypothetical protein MUC87_14545 [Bacteroidia bacterium]|jgi:thiamine transporter ThiT|nr:hypothetical protein [Bacteroidia bacterium]